MKVDKPKLQSTPAWINLAAVLIRHLPVGRYRLMNGLCSSPPSTFIQNMPKEFGGYSFVCNLQDSIAREVCFTGHYEPQETALVRAILKPGMSFVDVGANWGYFTLLAAYLVGELGRVISFEPDPRLFPILQENVSSNKLNQVVTLQLAAANLEGILTLAGHDEKSEKWGLSKLVEHADASVRTFEVATCTLDHALDEHGVDEIDLLKMDIEGAEELALHGMHIGLSRYRYRRILLEVHPTILAERGRNAQDVISLLLEAGYRGWWVDSSPIANRRAAYSRHLNLQEYLRPVKDAECVDAWPHILWLSPGMELPG